ncbi:endolysin [Mycobacterium phage Shandong1]|uniref:Lysin A n=1 Tax=Mycobacterium phage Shandong1 TaxID=1983447 RepID=A0A1X9SHI5_9CAUD|nr:endolysin [Mycobacterium phage Shandong1]ARQ95470.1 lysin A [Mycobacterium phage Shandong1]
MTVTRANVEAAKGLVIPRLGNPYVYGGMISATNLRQGTDCSGIWNDVLAMAVGRFKWGRESEGATTGVGPFGTIRVARPQDIPADAAAKLAFHHEGSGGASSHMWGEIDGMRVESAGSKGLVTAPSAWPIDHPYANAWAYLPGPIVADGTPVGEVEPRDTLYADVSEWQAPVTDAYTNAGYKVLCIRSNDGTHRDVDWQSNYAWCKRAVDDGRLKFFIVYFVWRPNWTEAVATLKSQIGEPHPRMAVMVDVESWGGQITGDQSDGINAAFESIASWLGDRRRVIGYGNAGDLDRLWPRKPAGVRLVVAGYGRLPTYPGMIAHQYTDGTGWGRKTGLPDGAPPFGNCDMNAANGLTATQFAAALGIDTTEDDLLSALSPDEQREVLFLLRILADKRFVSRSPLRFLGEKETETVAGFGLNTDGLNHVQFVIDMVKIGDPWHINHLRTLAAAIGDARYPDRQEDCKLAKRILDELVDKRPTTPSTPTPPAPKPPAQPVKVSCASGGGGCVLVANGGDGTCALAGSECVLRKGAQA